MSQNCRLVETAIESTQPWQGNRHHEIDLPELLRVPVPGLGGQDLAEKPEPTELEAMNDSVERWLILIEAQDLEIGTPLPEAVEALREVASRLSW